MKAQGKTKPQGSMQPVILQAPHMSSPSCFRPLPEMEKKESQICIITVTGKDKVGIIARLSTAMTKANINIIDVNQNIMEDFFVMTMACDMVEATVNMKQIQTKISRIAKDMDLNITFQHEKIFKAMHRV